MSRYGERGILYGLEDATIACTYMMLAAHAKSLQSCWTGAFDDDEVRDILSLPQHIRPVSLLAVGKGHPPAQRTERMGIGEHVHRETWREGNMPDYIVTIEAAWLVRDVKSLDDAIGIAISEAGKRLNPAAKFVEVEAGYLTCPYCEETLSSAIVVADTALVGLILEMKVFRGESKEHAGRIAKSVIGKALRDVPLKLLDVEEQ